MLVQFVFMLPAQMSLPTTTTTIDRVLFIVLLAERPTILNAFETAANGDGGGGAAVVI